MKRNLIIFLVIAPLFGVLLAGIQVYYELAIWRYQGPDVLFTIKPGQGFSKINYQLQQQHIINNPKVFHRYAQFKGYMTKFKAGTYEIKNNSNLIEITNALVFGRPYTVKVTIPEGKNLFEIGKILEEKEIVDKKSFIAAAKSPQLAKALKIPAKRLEGYLFPETYHFPPKASAQDVIRAMVRQFRQQTKKIDFSKAHLNFHEVVILASIVEKETGASFERRKIAGVFHNRLKKRMRLQSDPTTIYGIYENFNGNLRKKHLLEKTPYNTYKISGLPVGPICNPGPQAIEAVLDPEEHNYLYFVSMNDGTHVFSRSYKDHLKAVDKYQKQRRYRKGRSWRDLKKKSKN